jgi:branched-chain amino acid transport system substrate-binding protein
MRFRQRTELGARRTIGWRVPFVALAAVATVGLAATTSSAKSGGAGSTAKASVAITDYVKYVGGTKGKADPKLAPVNIGWVNNQGGSLVIAGTSPTDGAETAVKWINKFAGGIGGHPLKLVKCFVKNAEAEGLKCAQQFLNDRSINVIAYGALAVGANTINSTVAGKKPIVETIGIGSSDAVQKNNFVLFTALPFVVYPWGNFAKKVLNAKSVAIVYPTQPGQLIVAEAVRDAAVAEGMTAKVVGFDPTTNDLIGALTAAGAQTADMIMPAVGAPDQCLAVAKAIDQLGIDQGKVAGFFNCAVPSIKASYNGGDYPKWYYGIASGGDGYLNTPAGKTFRAALNAFGKKSLATDPWTPSEFASIMTIAKYMNKIGFDKLSPAAIAKQAKAFRGPILLGPPTIHCGKYPKLPAICADGASFFRYQGNDTYTRAPGGWFETPAALQTQNGAKTVTP